MSDNKSTMNNIFEGAVMGGDIPRPMAVLGTLINMAVDAGLPEQVIRGFVRLYLRGLRRVEAGDVEPEPSVEMEDDQ